MSVESFMAWSASSTLLVNPISDTLCLWQYARGRTLVRWAAYLSTLLCVLEYTVRRTGVIQTNVLLYASPTYWYAPEQRTGFISQQRIGLIIPVDVLFITLELHLLCHACLFQGIQHNPLLLGSEGRVASSALVIGGATELICQYHREAVILAGEHPFLEVGEAAGIGDGFVAAVKLALVILAAPVGVHHIQDVALFQQRRIDNLMQAGLSHWAVPMQANGIARGDRGVEFLWHNKLVYRFSLCVM